MVRISLLAGVLAATVAVTAAPIPRPLGPPMAAEMAVQALANTSIGSDTNTNSVSSEDAVSLLVILLSFEQKQPSDNVLSSQSDHSVQAPVVNGQSISFNNKNPALDKKPDVLGSKFYTQNSQKGKPKAQSGAHSQKGGKKSRRAIAQADLEDQLTRRELEAWLQARAPKGFGLKSSTMHGSEPHGKPTSKSVGQEEKGSGSSFGEKLMNGASSFLPMLGGGGGMGGPNIGGDTNQNGLSSVDQSYHGVSAGVRNGQMLSF